MTKPREKTREERTCVVWEYQSSQFVSKGIIGHANAKTVHEVYLHWKSPMLADAAAKLDALLV